MNVSIGGTLIHFAAPPVLMVAAKWNLDIVYTITHVGWKAAIAVFINAGVLTFLFAKEINSMGHRQIPYTACPAGWWPAPGVWWPSCLPTTRLPHCRVSAVHGRGHVAYPAHQERLILREGLLGLLLGGLVVLGGMQQWWLQPVLLSMDATTVYFWATALTAITDNAALTYLASLVEGLSPEFKYAVLTGAVTGGGLTIIANAPNPAGIILKGTFHEGPFPLLSLFWEPCPHHRGFIVCF